jgi:F plasmid transfer operon protein
MKRNIRADLELGAQVVIAIAVLVVAGVLVKRQVFPSPSRTSAPQINAGEKLNVPNVDWERNRKSLVFFLQKGCHYCTESAPFYRQLIADAARKNISSLAILPNSADDSRQYLQSLGLPIENVQTGPLASFKVNGTPTVMLVNQQGIVMSVWFGAAPEREKEIRDKLDHLFDADN